MENTLHKVTREWINTHKTSKGAWTRKQILALGLDWPPKSGWVQAISGELITHEAARKFEEGKGQYAPLKSMKLKRIKATLKTMDMAHLDDLKAYINKLLSKSTKGDMR